MLSKVGDNEAGELKGRLFLDLQEFVPRQFACISHNVDKERCVKEILEAFISAENLSSGSPDLNRLYCKLWAVLKDMYSQKRHKRTETLKGSHVMAAARIPLETERAVTAKWPECLEACLKADRGHFE